MKQPGIRSLLILNVVRQQYIQKRGMSEKLRLRLGLRLKLYKLLI